MRLDNKDGSGDEFDYYDEFPEDDPFMPKPTCTVCKGEGGLVGMATWENYVCPRCHGTGVEP